MKNVLILAVFMIVVVAAGCIFDMNDNYDKGTGGSYMVTGTFVDASGNGISGLTVVLSGGGTDATAVTDASGMYMFEDVATGSYTIKPGSRGYGSMTLVVSGATDVGVNNDGHGGKVGQDYTCSGCHK
ncbi:carboxypeptidase-like regulatory domain-containing protein [Candidatus Latescibacterota bacterium]